jgi:hypothetical protein
VFVIAFAISTIINAGLRVERGPKGHPLRRWLMNASPAAIAIVPIGLLALLLSLLKTKTKTPSVGGLQSGFHPPGYESFDQFCQTLIM